MWGSTSPNTADECTWTNAPFNNGLDSYYEEYFTTHKSEWLDSKDNLKPEYDAARAIMGGDWRMPTWTECQELLNNTTNEWIIVNGVNGKKFTSKTDTSKYIFIPAAGDCSSGSVDDVGIGAQVWSSSLDTSNPDRACLLYFFPGEMGMGNIYRYKGQSVRGVRK